MCVSVEADALLIAGGLLNRAGGPKSIRSHTAREVRVPIRERLTRQSAPRPKWIYNIMISVFIIICRAASEGYAWSLRMKYGFMTDFKSSGTWRSGWCASSSTSLSSHRALKALLPTLCLALVVVYGLADKLRSFVSSVFIPQYHFPYAVALAFAQVVVSILALNLLHVLNLVPLRRYSRSLGEKMLVPSICNSIHAVLAMWAKANTSNVGLFPLLLPLLPVATLGFSFSQKLASSPSLHISAPISLLGGTSFVVTASQGLSGVGFLEYMYAPLALILHSLSLTCLAKVSEAERRCPPEAQSSIFDIYYTQLVNQSGVLGLLWLLHPQSPWQVLSRSSWQSLLFHGYLLAILLLGTVLDFLVGVSALCVSPFAAALLHSARQLVQPLLQLL